MVTDPQGFVGLPPGWQILLIAVSTFVQEDIPTVSSALLAAAGRMNPTVAFLGCFLGIWLGDALLYALARFGGRPLLDSRLGRRLTTLAAIERSEGWFAHRGLWLLLISRFVPGTRLPTYLAAGFLRVPLPRFLAATGIAVAAWTAGIFALARWSGPTLTRWLPSGPRGFWQVPAGLVLVWLLVWCLGRWRSRGGTGAWLTRLQRWRHWEFWPAPVFYFPVVLRYVQLAWRHGGLTVPTAANPGMSTGGFVGESKVVTLRELYQTSPEFTAEAWLLPPAPLPERQRQFAELRLQHCLSYPCILKPDVGQRGQGVKKIQSDAEANAYLAANPTPVIAQRYVAGPHEVGLFYYRFPDEPRGHLFAITEKLFPEVIGDGRSTVEDLIRRDERARLIADLYLQRFSHRRAEVLPAGERLRLVEAGNHAQGCIFRDGARFRTPELEARIDVLSQGISGFYIGRYDVRYGSEDDLRAGRGFQILELNGATAEATSIYDARRSLRSAYATLFRQWELVFLIGSANRARGHAPDSARALWRAWRETRRQCAAYPAAD